MHVAVVEVSAGEVDVGGGGPRGVGRRRQRLPAQSRAFAQRQTRHQRRRPAAHHQVLRQLHACKGERLKRRARRSRGPEGAGTHGRSRRGRPGGSRGGTGSARAAPRRATPSRRCARSRRPTSRGGRLRSTSRVSGALPGGGPRDAAATRLRAAAGAARGRRARPRVVRRPAAATAPRRAADCTATPASPRSWTTSAGTASSPAPRSPAAAATADREHPVTTERERARRTRRRRTHVVAATDGEAVATVVVGALHALEVCVHPVQHARRQVGRQRRRVHQLQRGQRAPILAGQRRAAHRRRRGAPRRPEHQPRRGVQREAVHLTEAGVHQQATAAQSSLAHVQRLAAPVHQVPVERHPVDGQMRHGCNNRRV